MGLSWWVKGGGSKYEAPKSEEDKIKDLKVKQKVQRHVNSKLHRFTACGEPTRLRRWLE